MEATRRHHWRSNGDKDLTSKSVPVVGDARVLKEQSDDSDWLVNSLLVNLDGVAASGWREEDTEQDGQRDSLRGSSLHQERDRSDGTGVESVAVRARVPQNGIGHIGVEDGNPLRPREDSTSFYPLYAEPVVAQEHFRMAGRSTRLKGPLSRTDKHMRLPHSGKSLWLRGLLPVLSKRTRRMMAVVVFLLVVRILIRCFQLGALSSRKSFPRAAGLHSTPSRRLSDAPDTRKECQQGGVGHGLVPRSALHDGSQTVSGADADDSDMTDDDRESEDETSGFSSDEEGDEVDSEFEEELNNLEVLSRASKSRGSTPRVSPASVADDEETELTDEDFSDVPYSPTLFTHAGGGGAARGSAFNFFLDPIDRPARPGGVAVPTVADAPGSLDQANTPSSQEEGKEESAGHRSVGAPGLSAPRAPDEKHTERQPNRDAAPRLRPPLKWPVIRYVPGTGVRFTARALLDEAQRLLAGTTSRGIPGVLREKAAQARESVWTLSLLSDRKALKAGLQIYREAMLKLYEMNGPGPLKHHGEVIGRMTPIPEAEDEDIAAF